MKGKNIFAVLAISFTISMFASSCGGGGGGGASIKEEPSSLTINNACPGSIDAYVNNVFGGTLAPAQSKKGSVAPGVYTVKLCVTNTTTCETKSVVIPERTDYYLNACG